MVRGVVSSMMRGGETLRGGEASRNLHTIEDTADAVGGAVISGHGVLPVLWPGLIVHVELDQRAPQAIVSHDAYRDRLQLPQLSVWQRSILYLKRESQPPPTFRLYAAKLLESKPCRDQNFTVQSF